LDWGRARRRPRRSAFTFTGYPIPGNGLKGQVLKGRNARVPWFFYRFDGQQRTSSPPGKIQNFKPFGWKRPLPVTLSFVGRNEETAGTLYNPRTGAQSGRFRRRTCEVRSQTSRIKSCVIHRKFSPTTASSRAVRFESRRVAGRPGETKERLSFLFDLADVDISGAIRLAVGRFRLLERRDAAAGPVARLLDHPRRTTTRTAVVRPRTIGKAGGIGKNWRGRGRHACSFSRGKRRSGSTRTKDKQKWQPFFECF